MGTLYVDTGGNALNSGSRDSASALLTGAAATVAGSVVTLDGSPDLSVLNVSGANQDSILIADATNANMKIFWITAFDNTAKTVTVHAAPTGVTSSAWRIGGQHVLTNASIEGAVRAGDTVIFNNSPASAAATRWTFRNAGNATAGPAKIKGKTGVRPQLITTNTAHCITAPAFQTDCWIENLEIIQQGASGDAIRAFGAGLTVVNVKVSDCGGSALNNTGGSSGWRILFNEFSGSSDFAFYQSAGGGFVVVGNYIHDCAGGIFSYAVNPNSVYAFNIFDSNDSQHYWLNAAPMNQSGSSLFLNNIFYLCNNSGITIDDVDQNVAFLGNIFKDNGNSGSEYNLNLAGGVAPYVFGDFNIFNISGGRGGSNVNNYTLGANDKTSDPLWTAPGSGNFSLQDGSPAIAAAFPGQFLGGSLGYLDIGSVQKQAGAGGIAFAKMPTSRLVGKI